MQDPLQPLRFLWVLFAGWIHREQGVAVDEPVEHHVLRSLGRVAARRALQLCHIVTVEGREVSPVVSGLRNAINSGRWTMGGA
jgi:hypothetical protein